MSNLGVPLWILGAIVVVGIFSLVADWLGWFRGGEDE